MKKMLTIKDLAKLVELNEATVYNLAQELYSPFQMPLGPDSSLLQLSCWPVPRTLWTDTLLEAVERSLCQELSLILWLKICSP